MTITSFPRHNSEGWMTHLVHSLFTAMAKYSNFTCATVASNGHTVDHVKNSGQLYHY